ncbi:MAG: hypothetical protein IT195_10025, partial [Microthrixaceae bacterium]|nr:hypothetical protein [Microthrixaceae bacterium]
MKNAIHFLLLLWLCAPSNAATRPDNIAGAGWHNVSRREDGLPVVVSGTQQGRQPKWPVAKTAGAAIAMAGAGGGNFADEATPEIQSLARGLENDPARIFAFVRDRVDYEQYFGCKKGAYLTLLEGRGNDFDQCALLVSLLRAAGFSAQYKFGPQWVPMSGGGGTNLMDWIGLETNSTEFAANFIGGRGAPRAVWYATGVEFQRVWVEVSVAGNTYPLDPSFKCYEASAGTNILSVAGLNRSGLLSQAGGTTTADSVQNLSESALGAELTRGTSNLVAWIEAQAPNASPVEVLGGRRLLPSAGATLAGGAPPFAETNSGQFPSAVAWDAIPTEWMSSLTVKLPGMDRKFFFPELQARRLSVSFAGTTAKLWLDDAWVGTGTVASATFKMTNVIDHSYGGYWGGQFVDTGFADQAGGMDCKRADGYVYVILYDFNPGSLRLRRRQEKLDEYLRAGLADSSREVRSETLHIMGLNWLLQTELCDRVFAPQGRVSNANFHRVGRMAQEEGYYVDVPLAFSAMRSADGNMDRFRDAYEMSTYFYSALEHGVVEQMQGGGNSAASTIKLLQLANAGGTKIFRATSANYTSVVRPQLVSTYSPDSLAKIDAEIASGSTVLLPANGQITLNQWRGTGYVASRHTLASSYVGMIISGNYFGGYNSTPAAVSSQPVIEWGRNETSYPKQGYASLSDAPTVPYASPPTFSNDPVDMASGAYIYDKADLSIDADTQRPLAFARHYDSNRRNLDPTALGYGWTHNWHIRATRRSDIKAGLGETTPAEMAPALVATAAALEVFSGSSTAKEWAVAALIARWGVDALKENAVSVTMGKDAVQFVRLPDGRFLRPQGLTHTLAKVSNHYELTERHGRTFKFLDDGKLNDIVDPSGQRLVCSYNNGVLSQVQKEIPNTDPALVFTYSNGRLASVAARARLLNDGSQLDRTLGFAQSGSNLVAVTDPDGNAWGYTYDAEHRMTSLRDPASRLIITNFYDTEGRVIEQWGEGDPDKRWQLFYAGFASAEIDPSGARKRYFYDDMGRAVGAEDALGNLTTLAYDGQGHLVEQTSPLGETTSRTYDANHNVILVTDPAGNTVSNAYDAAHHLVETWDPRGHRTRYAWTAKHQLSSVTDPLDNKTSFAYDAAGNLIAATNAAGLVTRFTPDGAGRHLVTTVTHPDNTTEQFTYNQWGQRLSSVDGRNNTTTFAYNNRGMLTRTVAPLSATVSNAYDSSGNLAATVDPRGYATTHAYSSTAKRLSTTLPAIPAGTPVIENLYDDRDWLAETRDPLDYATTLGYDPAGRVTAATDPLSRTVRTGFDADGRPVVVTNALGHVTRTFYDERGLAVEVRDALNQSIRSRFDANGNQVALTNRLANGWSFAFDANNRLLSTTSPLGRTWSQTYNSRGLVATVTEPSTQSATLLYNSRGWLSSRADSLGTVTNTFDANGNVLTVKEGAATITRQYDALNRVTNYVNAAGQSIRYTYDAASNLTSLRYPDGKTVTY